MSLNPECQLVLVFYAFHLNGVECSNQVDVIYTDLRKTYDTVNIDTLVYKLSNFDQKDPLLSWLSSYLH